MAHLSVAARLSRKDYFREWRISGAFIIALAAVLGPMMVLFGLKFGVIGGMVEDLVKDPRNREITLLGNGRFEQAWFKQMADRSEVAFVVPRTRRIAATLQMTRPGLGRIMGMELIPSGKEDPLLQNLGGFPKGYNEVVLSYQAARQLKVKAGDKVTGNVSRRFQGKADRKSLELTVVAVAPAVSFNREGLFVSVELMEAVESYLDGRRVAALGWEGMAHDANRTYPSFRLYTSRLEDVATLSDEFVEKGLRVRTRSDDIEVVNRLDRNLTLLFWLIAVIGLSGYSLSLGASLLANVDRKRKELSVLRLVGLGTGDIVIFPMLQAIYTAFLGWVMATLIFYAVSLSMNQMFAEQLNAGQSLCRLLPIHLLIALGLTMACAIVAAFVGGIRAAKIEPSEGLRDV
jgi:putative ABC transport system permease protein